MNMQLKDVWKNVASRRAGENNFKHIHHIPILSMSFVLFQYPCQGRRKVIYTPVHDLRCGIRTKKSKIILCVVINTRKTKKRWTRLRLWLMSFAQHEALKQEGRSLIVSKVQHRMLPPASRRGCFHYPFKFKATKQWTGAVNTPTRGSTRGSAGRYDYSISDTGTASAPNAVYKRILSAVLADRIYTRSPEAHVRYANCIGEGAARSQEPIWGSSPLRLVDVLSILDQPYKQLFKWISRLEPVGRAIHTSKQTEQMNK